MMTRAFPGTPAVFLCAALALALALAAPSAVGAFHQQPPSPCSGRGQEPPSASLPARRGEGSEAEGGRDRRSRRRRFLGRRTHPLREAGETFVAASTQSMGMLFYNVGGLDHKDVQASLLAAGTHLLAASDAWEDRGEWDGVAEEISAAAGVFAGVADLFGSAQIDDAEGLATLFEAVGLELGDMAGITGCMSTGPAGSVPNLYAIRDHLEAVAEILRINAVAETDDHDMILSFVGASDSFGRLADRHS